MILDFAPEREFRGLLIPGRLRGSFFTTKYAKGTKRAVVDPFRYSP